MTMKGVFELRDNIVEDYKVFSRSFSTIMAKDILENVEKEYSNNRYWPDAMIQINPHYKTRGTVESLVCEGLLHPDCARIFRLKGDDDGEIKSLTLYEHQVQSIAKAREGKSFIVTTGTGSGKSLSFFIPIVDRVLRNREHGIEGKTKAIVIYPMNALANSQMEELNKFLNSAPGEKSFSFERYTGQEDQQTRKKIADNPPDILLTNYMMLELILTRFDSDVDRRIIENCSGLEFLVLDELHTYRGRQGADVAILVRRLRERLAAKNLICIGTSATMKSQKLMRLKADDAAFTVEEAASKLFGETIPSEAIIGETLQRVTDEMLYVMHISTELAAEIKVGRYRWQESGYDYEKFKKDPMAVWVELTLGIDMSSGSPERARPLTLREASEQLHKDIGVSVEKAEDVLSDFLIHAQEVKMPFNKTPFAFKLHQFISGPGKVSCSLEPEGIRTVTLDEQQYAPLREEKNIPLYHTYFCRECGQEYHPVWYDGKVFKQRGIDDTSGDDGTAFGLLAPAADGQSYSDEEDLPDNWFDYRDGQPPKLKSNYKKKKPEKVCVDKFGRYSNSSPSFWYLPGKFGFCVRCLTSHDTHGKDINRLAGISGEGRSSATSVLTFAVIKELQRTHGNPKMLGFVDNRQDAALQAGHFNDFFFSAAAALLSSMRA